MHLPALLMDIVFQSVSTPAAPQKAIPDVIMSGLIGSGLTVLGVIITNWNNNRIQRKSLDHDRSIKIEDRSVVLRKEVYIRATNCVNEMEDALTRAATIEISERSRVRRDFWQALAHLEIVSTLATREIAVELRKQWKRALSELAPAGRLLRSSRKASDLCFAELNEAIDEYNQILDEIGRNPSDRQEVRLSHADARSNVLQIEYQAKNAEYKELLVKFKMSVKFHLSPARLLQEKLINSFRNDLGLKFF